MSLEVNIIRDRYPLDLLKKIIKFTNHSTLKKMREVCKRFHQIIETIPYWVNIPKLKPDIVQLNLLYYANSGLPMYVDKRGRIQVIQDQGYFNFIHRYFFGEIYSSEADEKIKYRILELTFNEIYRLNKRGYAAQGLRNDRRMYSYNDRSTYRNWHVPAYRTAWKIKSEIYPASVIKALDLVIGQRALYHQSSTSSNPYYDERCLIEKVYEHAIFWQGCRLDYKY